MSAVSWAKTRGMTRKAKAYQSWVRMDTLAAFGPHQVQSVQRESSSSDSQPAPRPRLFLTTSQEWERGRISSQGSGKAPHQAPSIPGFGWAYLLLWPTPCQCPRSRASFSVPEVSSLLSSGNVPREKEGLPRPCFEGVVLWTKGMLNSRGGQEWGMAWWVSSWPLSGLRLLESRG